MYELLFSNETFPTIFSCKIQLINMHQKQWYSQSVEQHYAFKLITNLMYMSMCVCASSFPLDVRLNKSLSVWLDSVNGKASFQINHSTFNNYTQIHLNYPNLLFCFFAPFILKINMLPLEVISICLRKRKNTF